MTWLEALTYAQSSIGIAAIVGVLVFVTSEYVPGFVEVIENPKIKRLMVLVLSMIIPVGALLLELFTVSYAPVTFDVLWQALFTGIASFGFATAVHTTVMKSKT